MQLNGLRCLLLACVYLACMVGTIQAQCSPPTAGPNMVFSSDADIDKETFDEGSTVRFKCDIGYSPMGGRPTVTCSGGQWSPDVPSLVCELKTCGSLGEITNGGADTSGGITHGSTATFYCNKGYYMIPQNARRRCMDGEWDGRNPVCQVVMCGAPPTVVNGELTTPPGSEYEYGSVVQYRCNGNNILVGDSNIVCRQEGTTDVGVWTPSPPECKIVKCPSPSVENGRRTAGRPPYEYRSFVTFACDEGFEMAGGHPGTSNCAKNSSWVPPLPTCQRKATTTTTKATTTATTTKKPIIPGPDPTKSPPPGPPVGWIVGGIIGGLVAIGLIVFGVQRFSSKGGYSESKAIKKDATPHEDL